VVICQANRDDRSRLIVFGLSAANVQRLQAGELICCSRASYGMAMPEDLTVLIFVGDTEQDIEHLLRANGLIDPQTTVVNQRRPQ
jgi:hypothetical protein